MSAGNAGVSSSLSPCFSGHCPEGFVRERVLVSLSPWLCGPLSRRFCSGARTCLSQIALAIGFCFYWNQVACPAASQLSPNLSASLSPSLSGQLSGFSCGELVVLFVFQLVWSNVACGALASFPASMVKCQRQMRCKNALISNILPTFFYLGSICSCKVRSAQGFSGLTSTMPCQGASL